LAATAAGAGFFAAGFRRGGAFWAKVPAVSVAHNKNTPK
jgi:hypothetical protein